nr:phosphoenolpyruvate--protein phosphotransferase [uncultured Microbacterium sp.]
MIGIVAVSHSARLGEAALELALQMVHGESARVLVAAGAGTDADGAPILGTDAVAVASAIDGLAVDCEGVLVVMDLGSALMSADLAMELRTSDVPVRLTAAPFVEGLLAAVVAAAAGGSLDDVAREAAAALEAKVGQLGGAVEASPVGDPFLDDSSGDPAGSPDGGDALTTVVRVQNPFGIHARPAALIAEASTGADVRLRRLPDGPEARGASLSRLLMLGARQGAEVELSARGAQAQSVIDRLVSLFENGFGEGSGGTESTSVTTSVATSLEAPASVDASVDAPSSPPARPLQPGAALHGRGVSAGRAAAPVVHLSAPVQEPDPAVSVAVEGRDDEVSAIERASAAVADQLRSRSARATGDASAILDASRMMASDPELIAGASALVRAEGRTAARAVWEAADVYEEALAALGGRMAERVTDVRDVRDRIVAEIVGVELPGVPLHDEPFVLVAVDLAPAETAALGASGCVALVTEQGGPTSHTAIIARSLGLPAVVGVADAMGIAAGAVVLVDGDRGTVEVDPDETLIRVVDTATIAEPFRGEGALADGHRISLLANVGGPSEAVTAAESGAEGIGLFRTEFCFLDRVDAPSVDEQVAAYRGVLAAFPGRRVVVRTLDAGSDKPLPFANVDVETNPALGVRGLRVARRSPMLLDDQLRALALAAEAEQAVVEVMAPMVATVDEARAFAESARAAGLEKVGIMIETPSAALLASELFEIVDFVSIGTNDLAQYTLAADRLLGELGDLNDPWQPSVLRLIGMAGAAGRAWNLPVGVCGEAAADPALAPVLVGLGVSSLSMTPRALTGVAAALAEVTYDRCGAAAEAVLKAATAIDARAAALAVLSDGNAQRAGRV